MDNVHHSLHVKQIIAAQEAVKRGLLDPAAVDGLMASATAEVLADVEQIQWDALVGEVEQAFMEIGK